MQTTCNAQWGSKAECERKCNYHPAGTNDDTSGNTLGCRVYHLGIAKTDANAAKVHCAHAGPEGANVCGSPCDFFCDAMESSCSGTYTSKANCLSTCSGFTAGASTDTAAQSKKFRKAIDGWADEFVCPITQELPVDPVTASHGSC